MSDQPLCVIVGAGPGNGQAFAHAFAGAGFRVALLARDGPRVQALARACGGTGFSCDVREPKAVAAAFAQVRAALGEADVLVYNAGTGKFGNLDAVTAADLESAWRTNALGCFLSVQEVVPAMRRRQRGSIVVIGATASVKGSANFIAFASAKAALRSLAQSLARQLGPEGIHVSHVVIDGVIDLERTRAAMPDKPDSYFLKPAEIAASVLHLARQPKSAWTFELDLRPFGERW
jgi:NAD(P)-dependent dehydrogenase (short-subunit alcohol dehydrogenase family)